MSKPKTDILNCRQCGKELTTRGVAYCSEDCREIKKKQTERVEITPAMLKKMKAALKKNNWSLYRLRKETDKKISYNTLLDIFSDSPASNFRHRAKMLLIFSALGLTLE